MEDVLIIRADGTEESHSIPSFDEDYAGYRKALVELLKFDDFDLAPLTDGRTMYVDGNGWQTERVTRPGYVGLIPVRPNKPYNRKATELYWASSGTTHQIVGDVAIVKEHEEKF